MYRSCVTLAAALLSGSAWSAPVQSGNPAAILFARASPQSDTLSCPASSWPPTSIGVENTPQTVDNSLADILSQVSPINIEATIEKLVSFGTRATLSVDISNETFGIGGARDWLYDQYAAFAAASDKGAYPFLNSYIQEPDGERITFAVNISSPGLFVPGSSYKSPEDPGRVYLISGHYDSRNTDPIDYENPAPGANDDASGVSLSVELARIFSSPHVPQLRASLVFVAVAGEEQGLYGAENLAYTYRNATPSVNLEGMLNCDTVGSPNARNVDDTGNAPSKSDPHTIRLFAQGIPPLSAENSTVREQRLSIGGDNDSPTRNLARFIKEVTENEQTDMQVAVVNRLDRYLRGGDHRPFLEAGYAAVRFTEPYENYRHQHQDVRLDVDPDYPEAGDVQYGDLIDFVDFEYTARVGRVNAAALYSLAQSPGIPLNVRVNTTELANDSQFLWDSPADSETEVEAYEVVWRATTAPQWQKVLDVGMGEEASGGSGRRTVTVDISKDNVVFGIRARSKGGFRGVAVLPFPES